MDTKSPQDPGYHTNMAQKTEYIVAYKPDYSLKKTIGVEVSLSDIFTPEKIVEIERNCFFMDAEEEVKKISDLIAKSKEGEPKCLRDAAALAASLKGEAEMYGFPYIFKICAFLADACESRESPEIKHPLVFDLVTALASSIKKKITDGGGSEEKAILANLACLSAKPPPLKSAGQTCTTS